LDGLDKIVLNTPWGMVTTLSPGAHFNRTLIAIRLWLVVDANRIAGVPKREAARRAAQASWRRFQLESAGVGAAMVSKITRLVSA
jgi:hypothetical protein